MFESKGVKNMKIGALVVIRLKIVLELFSFNIKSDRSYKFISTYILKMPYGCSNG